MVVVAREEGTRKTGESAMGAIPAKPSARLNQEHPVHVVSEIPRRKSPMEVRIQAV